MSPDFQRTLALFSLICLAGCAGTSTDRFAAQDQLESINRPIFSFNLTFDRFIMKPINQAYDVLPQTVRMGVENFFTNLSEPLNVVEGTLQANPKIVFTSLYRFITNSTIGIGGLYDFSATRGALFQDQSGGKTLAVWGVPSGSYFVIPFFGPSTLRGAAGEVGRLVFDPAGHVLNTPQQITQVAGDALTDSDEHRKTINTLYYESLSPYEATRSAFLQHQEHIN